MIKKSLTLPSNFPSLATSGDKVEEKESKKKSTKSEQKVD